MNVIDCEKFSNFKFLIRVTARVLRFLEKMLDRSLGVYNVHYSSSELEADELNRAETLRICSIQFEKEIRYLKCNSGQNKFPYIDQFGLFLDAHNLLKCKGRINNSSLSVTEKNPGLLPLKHPFVKMLVTDAHHSTKHGGVNDILVALRCQYWILKGRQIVKFIVRSCVICKKLEGLPYCSQPSPDLPTCRVSDDPPFSHTGLDFAGPVYCRESRNVSDHSKGYICLFTCASTRAIHLELTRGMSADQFLLAFRRFTGRRGLPTTLLSDNAKTFKSSSKEIRSICHSPEVFRYLTDQRTSWRFIVARAPWWGGFWERMVRSVKRCLKKVVGRTTLTFDELGTLLIEIESVVNSRPLTYVYDDQEGVSYALTPAHLIYGRQLATSPNASHFEIVSTNKTLTRRARHHKNLLTQLTNRWRKEYLSSLLEFRGAKLKGSGSPVKVGDVVILKNHNIKRIFWKLAKVIELLSGSDGVARAALINVSDESGPPKVLKRSIRYLIPIEVNDEDVGHGEQSSATGDTAPTMRTLSWERSHAKSTIILLLRLLLDLEDKLQFWEKLPVECGLDNNIFCVCSLCDQQGECVRIMLYFIM